MTQTNGTRGSEVAVGIPEHPPILESTTAGEIPARGTAEPATRTRQRAREQIRQNRFVIIAAGAVVTALLLFAMISAPRKALPQKTKDPAATGQNAVLQGENLSPEKNLLPITDSGCPAAKEMHDGYMNEQDLQRTAIRRAPSSAAHPPSASMTGTLASIPPFGKQPWQAPPYQPGTLYGTEFDPELGRKVKFVIAETQDLSQDAVYSKERRLIEDVKKELAEGRRCQVFAVYTLKRDVTARLEKIFNREGIRTAVLRRTISTDKREAWYAKRVKEGVQVVIAHPRLVETGLDLLDFPTIIFYESGYSLHTLRQASRRSWRIGQKRPVRVKFMCYEGTMQTSCLRLMGKKLLVALTMEGKFASEGLQSIDEDDDMLAAMARELVEKNGIGDSADAIWKALHQEHQKLFPTDQSAPERSETDNAAAEASWEPASLIETAMDMAPVLAFGQQPEELKSHRRRARVPAPEQPSLFNWS
jgi:hypothetical protein